MYQIPNHSQRGALGGGGEKGLLFLTADGKKKAREASQGRRRGKQKTAAMRRREGRTVSLCSCGAGRLVALEIRGGT